MRRTKIVCTIGPASSSAAELDRLVAAGLDVARLNFSHGTHEEHAEVIERIREGEARWGRRIAILQDLQGPKIRLGTFGAGGGGGAGASRAGRPSGAGRSAWERSVPAAAAASTSSRASRSRFAPARWWAPRS